MKDAPPDKRRIRLGKLWWWMAMVFAALIGWQMWNLSLYNAAVREAKEARFLWQCDDTISLIRQDWRNALKKETWGAHPRLLNMGFRVVGDLGRYRDMLHSLRPTRLIAMGCDNVDALKGLTSLKAVSIIVSDTLQNVDGLKSLTGLQKLSLGGCNKIPTAALRELRAALPNTDITFPDGSKNPLRHRLGG